LNCIHQLTNPANLCQVIENSSGLVLRNFLSKFWETWCEECDVYHILVTWPIQCRGSRSWFVIRTTLGGSQNNNIDYLASSNIGPIRPDLVGQYYRSLHSTSGGSGRNQSGYYGYRVEQFVSFSRTTPNRRSECQCFTVVYFLHVQCHVLLFQRSQSRACSILQTTYSMSSISMTTTQNVRNGVEMT
jgi:hypothetical protein